ncbi:hypothetical protein [Aneurinibacillus terranovensis]|uniref:hypothetical protein n=1 Tax=Aneurinibacillus terranovensis TaxID=278991 RepID=UPI000411C3C6|nr:hypothetical protein [Aneurinibacillus terranovensis]
MRPKCGFYFTAENIAMAKHNIEVLPWAKKAFAEYRRIADTFLAAHSDDKIYDCVLGMKDQTFAYGISGCPHCKKPFPTTPDKESLIFSEIPHKKVTCLHCQQSFPNEKYEDKGNGLVVDGKAYYLIGMWNFYTGGKLLGGVRNHEGLVTVLAYLYMITGEEKYAHKALVILDAFSAVFLHTIGPRDFTEYGSRFEIGRLHLLTSVVNRVKAFLAHDYDWLYHFDILDKPSPGRSKLGREGTMRENIEAMLQDYLLKAPGGPEYDLKNGNITELHNHEADGVRAMLAVGLVLDLPGPPPKLWRLGSGFTSDNDIG